MNVFLNTKRFFYSVLLIGNFTTTICMDLVKKNKDPIDIKQPTIKMIIDLETVSKGKVFGIIDKLTEFNEVITVTVDTKNPNIAKILLGMQITKTPKPVDIGCN